jgi:hypothetical protein
MSSTTFSETHVCTSGQNSPLLTHFYETVIKFLIRSTHKYFILRIGRTQHASQITKPTWLYHYVRRNITNVNTL